MERGNDEIRGDIKEGSLEAYHERERGEWEMLAKEKHHLRKGVGNRKERSTNVRKKKEDGNIKERGRGKRKRIERKIEKGRKTKGD